MTTRTCSTLLVLLFSISIARAQDLPTGPDWKATDLNGQTHQLYDYLNAGKVVFMDIFATWCPPCYTYHQSGKFKDLHNLYGPNGSNEARVFSIETDPQTGIQQLYGVQPQKPLAGRTRVLVFEQRNTFTARGFIRPVLIP
ncbi:MAG: redoxin domain-containing protein [Saprospiraceae bacterium]|nr:redoxin domain-containing protein [Saprospiraceae bacterium]